MADFNKAIDIVLKKEGGYINDPDDKGGETYAGISRRFHPKLVMWDIIDNIKTVNGLNNINSLIKNNNKIIIELKNVYKGKYWDVLRLDEIKSQKIALELFDDAVNRGTIPAIKNAQKSVNIPITGRMSKLLIDKLNNEK